MKHSYSVTTEKLDELISNAPSIDVRNALMELRGLRAVHAECNPSVFIKKDGTKLVIY